MRAILPAALAALAAALLAGCATLTPDSGFDAVRATVKTHAGADAVLATTDADRDAARRRVDALLAKPLAMDDAVQVALLNHRGLQATLGELRLADAARMRAGRLPNPHFSLTRARLGDEYTIEKALTLDVMALATLPWARAVEARRFEGAQREAALAVIRHAADTKKAWVEAVAAAEAVRYAAMVKESAEASAELGRRMARTGNFNKLMHAREQGFYADAALAHARAVRAETAARERLTRLLGLWGGAAAFTLPERLPDLPAAALDLPDIESRALATRLDIQQQRQQLASLAANLRLGTATRFVNALEFGPTRILEGHKTDPYKKGYELSLEIPLFDWGGARVAEAEGLYLQGVDRLAATAVDARSEVREAYQGYRLAHDIARHYKDEIVPIRKRVADENLLRYNGMIIGVFELLGDARAQVAGVTGYLDALRDYWLAKADLDMAMLGKPAPSTPTNSSAQPASAGGGH